MAKTVVFTFVSVLLAAATALAQKDPDSDGDGLSDFAEVHKHRTDPKKADSDGDGVPDGDWRERREYQYTIRTVVQVMRPVTPEFLTDDHQDARVLDATATWVELEVIHYPFTTVGTAIAADAKWRQTTAGMKEWTAPGPTADWTPGMRAQLTAALQQAGIDAGKLDDKTLVERAAKWLCAHAKNHDSFTTFVTAFDDKGRPFVPEDLLPAVPVTPDTMREQWQRDISARGMFEHGCRGSCSSSAIYLNGCLRALGLPTRIVLCIPLVDAGDERELQLVERGITHHALRERLLPPLRAIAGSWASHTFNEVFVGGRWRRLNYDRLGQDVLDDGMFGLMTHTATFSDWADARMPETIGRRQTLRVTGDVFGGRNPYSTIALRDEFGPHCKIENAQPEPVAARVTALHWGDGADCPADIRDWFTEREMFGLIACVEGVADFAEAQRLLETADRRVLLVADGKSTLGVGFEPGAFWWRDQRVWIVVPFGPADRRDLAPGVAYRFVPRNEKAAARWQVAAGVVVPARE